MSRILENAPSKVVVYARVARDERGALAAQVSRLRELAASQGWTDVTVIAEARPYGMTVEALRAVCGADIVFIRDMSRLERRLDHWEHVWAAMTAAGVYVVTTDGYDGVTSADPIQRMVLAATDRVAEQARADHAERTRRGIAVPETQGDRLMAAICQAFAEVERATHAERTRQGIAAAKARREAQR